MIKIKKISIILIFMSFLPISLNGQTQSVVFKLDSPDYITVNSNFEVSLIVTQKWKEFSSLEFFLMFNRDISLRDVQLKSYNISKNLQFETSDFKDYYGDVYKIKIDLNEDMIGSSKVFQIMYKLRAGDIFSAKMDFAVNFIKNGKIVQQYFSKKSSREEFFPVTKILNFYTPESVAGTSGRLNYKSQMDFTFTEELPISKIMYEFWMKMNSGENQFFSMIGKTSGDTLFKLNKNKFGYLSSSPAENVNTYTDKFLSQNSWYYFGIIVSNNDYLIKGYVNNNLIFDMPVSPLFDFKNFILAFSNGNEEGFIEIDRLKVWDFNNELDLSFKNKNYSFYSADSSRCLLNFDFSGEANSGRGEGQITEEGVKYLKSTAPVFSRSPKLNVNVFSSYYSIEWTPQDKNDINSFAVEKSHDGNNYYEIYSTGYFDSTQNTYNYSDPITSESEITFYRVKQINNDGTVVFSSSVKLGLGEKQLFELKDNFPNPFNPSTTITLNVFEDTYLELSVYNVVGKKLVTLFEGRIGQGIHQFEFDGTNFPSGIYFCEVKSTASSIVKKMLLAK